MEKCLVVRSSASNRAEKPIFKRIIGVNQRFQTSASAFPKWDTSPFLLFFLVHRKLPLAILSGCPNNFFLVLIYTPGWNKSSTSPKSVTNTASDDW